MGEIKAGLRGYTAAVGFCRSGGFQMINKEGKKKTVDKIPLLIKLSRLLSPAQVFVLLVATAWLYQANMQHTSIGCTCDIAGLLGTLHTGRLTLGIHLGGEWEPWRRRSCKSARAAVSAAENAARGTAAIPGAPQERCGTHRSPPVLARQSQWQEAKGGQRQQ